MLKEINASNAKESSESILEYARAVLKIRCGAKPRINAFKNQNLRNVWQLNTEIQKMDYASKRLYANKGQKEMKLTIFVFQFVLRTSIIRKKPKLVKKTLLCVKLAKDITPKQIHVNKLSARKIRSMINRLIAASHMFPRALDCAHLISLTGIQSVSIVKAVHQTDHFIIKITIDASLAQLAKFGTRLRIFAKNIALHTKS